MHVADECESVKLALVGDGGVGKTSLSIKYALNQFRTAHVATVGAAFLEKEVVIDLKKIKVQLWDTAGQEIFKSLIPMYLRGARAVLVVYDVSDRKSFLNVPLWLDDVYRRAPEEAQVALVCNKTDLQKVQVQPEEGKSLAESRNIPFFEVSAKNGTNVSVLFYSTVARVIRSERAPGLDLEKSISLTKHNEPAVSSGGCCAR